MGSIQYSWIFGGIDFFLTFRNCHISRRQNSQNWTFFMWCKSIKIFFEMCWCNLKAYLAWFNYVQFFFPQLHSGKCFCVIWDTWGMNSSPPGGWRSCLYPERSWSGFTGIWDRCWEVGRVGVTDGRIVAEMGQRKKRGVNLLVKANLFTP